MNYRAARHGFKIVELPIHFADRVAGESKMSLRVQLESALMPLRLRRYVLSGERQVSVVRQASSVNR
jgi:hypothetical protein